MPTLPTDESGKLVPYSDPDIAAMEIKRRNSADGSHVEYEFRPGGVGCKRKFSCDWASRFNALFYFAGAAVTYADSGDTKISRLVPLRDPDFPNWICTGARITGFKHDGTIETPAAGSEPLPVFVRAELECDFEMVPYDVKADDDTTLETERYVTWEGFPGADVNTTTDYLQMFGAIVNYRTIDGAARPANVPVPFFVGFPENKSTFKVIWRRVPQEVWGPSATLFQRVIGTEADRGYIGAVNLTTFRGYPPAQLQLLGVEQRLLPDPTGLGYSWDLGFVISQKPVPYGHLGVYYGGAALDPSAGPPGYYQVGRGTGTVEDVADIEDDGSLFHVREFADLFVVGELV